MLIRTKTFALSLMCLASQITLAATVTIVNHSNKTLEEGWLKQNNGYLFDSTLATIPSLTPGASKSYSIDDENLHNNETLEVYVKFSHSEYTGSITTVYKPTCILSNENNEATLTINKEIDASCYFEACSYPKLAITWEGCASTSWTYGGG